MKNLENLLRTDTDSVHNSWKILSPIALLLQETFILEVAGALYLKGSLTCREVSSLAAGGVSNLPPTGHQGLRLWIQPLNLCLCVSS